MQLNIAIDTDVHSEYPEVIVGAFSAAGLGRLELGSATPLFDDARGRLTHNGLTVENLTRHPAVAAWRDTFQRSGLKPSTFKSSPEQLARRILKGEAISTQFSLVDLYCAVSVRHLAPLGAYDLSCLPAAEVTLRRGKAGDVFRPLAGRAEDMPITGRTVLYASLNEVLCWGWNHRDSRTTCLRSTTTEAVFMGEGVCGEHAGRLREALGDLRERVREAGGTVGPIVEATAKDAQVALDVQSA